MGRYLVRCAAGTIEGLAIHRYILLDQYLGLGVQGLAVHRYILLDQYLGLGGCKSILTLWGQYLGLGVVGLAVTQTMHTLFDQNPGMVVDAFGSVSGVGG